MVKWGKVWGETTMLFWNQMASAHVLRIKRGGYSSVHRHARKHNYFYVVSGRLEIRVWPMADPVIGNRIGKNDLFDSTTLTAGDETTIPSGVWHQFRAIENTTAIEIYDIIGGDPDIERLDHGGLK